MKKRFVALALIVVMMALSCVVLVGCYEDRIVEVNTLVITMYRRTETGQEQIELGSPLKVGEKYIMQFSCDIVAKSSSDVQSLLELNVLLPPVKIANANVSDTNSGSSQTIEFNNAETGDIQREGSVIFKIPNNKNEVKNIFGNIELEPLMVGSSNINITFGASVGISLQGNSNDGYTKSIIIKNNKIDTPVLKYENEKLKWSHVKYADYYVIYADGKAIVDAEGKDVKVNVDKYTSKGTEITFDKLPEYLIGAHAITIRGFNESASYQVSDYSNEVSVEL